MKLLIDTHILIYWIQEPERLKKAHEDALDACEARKEPIYASMISLWEIAKLIELRRLKESRAPESIFEEIAAADSLQFLPINAQVAVESTRLGANFPRDPADQLIAATARVFGMQLITMDERIIQSKTVMIL
ncbi:MAG: type II toxin-antitoxin system VapC family toxin [Planctomycetes bacterium]|nr:type II toxin-antitoxin system VapC family toxin [Planctomycetota bacterium]